MECIFLDPAVANSVKLSMLLGENRVVQPFKWEISVETKPKL